MSIPEYEVMKVSEMILNAPLGWKLGDGFSSEFRRTIEANEVVKVTWSDGQWYADPIDERDE